MPKCKIETTGLYIRISETLITKLDAVAMERGFNRSEYIRHLIQNAVEKEESK
jgi:metal-responsive CopG/Arc/MetJ family transcriptional regulator